MPSGDTLAMVMCARNESRFLAANLLYHHALGVRKCYLFLDRCTDGSSDIAAVFPWVERIEIDPADSSRLAYVADLLAACMDRGLQLARRDGFEWLLVVDPDEFAYADLPRTRSESAIQAGDLTRLVCQVDRRVDLIRLKTKELVPQASSEELPFWQQKFFLNDDRFTRCFLDPGCGQEFEWQGPLGHNEGQSIVRTSAHAQAYDSHRWVVDQNRTFPSRPAYIPLASVDLGMHFHFAIVGQDHWLEKYQKLAHSPEVWPCGMPVELPKQCWKRATTLLSPNELKGYFQNWIGMSATELQELARRHVVEERDEVEQVLDEAGAIESNRLRLPAASQGKLSLRTTSWQLPRDYWRSATGGRDDGNSKTFFLADMDPQRLSNFYGVEHHRGVYFRWAQPLVELTLPLPPDNYELRIDSEHLWPCWSGNVRAIVNGNTIHTVSRRSVRGIVSLPIPRDAFVPTAKQHLCLSFDAVPGGSHPGDTRRLGAPIVSLSFKRSPPRRIKLW